MEICTRKYLYITNSFYVLPAIFFPLPSFFVSLSFANRRPETRQQCVQNFWETKNKYNFAIFFSAEACMNSLLFNGRILYFIICSVRNRLFEIHSDGVRRVENNNIIKNNVRRKTIELIGLYVLHLRDTPIEIESTIKCCCFVCTLFFISCIFWLLLCVCVMSICVDRLDTMHERERETKKKKHSLRIRITNFQVVCGTWINVFTYTSHFAGR